MNKEQIENVVKEFLKAKDMETQVSVLEGSNVGYEVKTGSGTTTRSTMIEGFDAQQDRKKLDEWLERL